MPDAPLPTLAGPVEFNEGYITAGLKGRERDQQSRSHGLSKRGRGTHAEDKPPVFLIVDRSTDHRYVVTAKSTDESTVRLLLENSEEESLAVYMDDFEPMTR